MPELADGGLSSATAMPSDAIDSMFEGTGDTAVETAPDSGIVLPDETPAADPQPETSDDEISIDEALDSLGQEEAAEPTEEKAAPVEEDVPEATLETDKDGQKFYKYPEARGRKIYQAYQTLQTIKAELGLDRVDAKVVESLVDADRTLSQMRLDFISGDPRKSKQFVEHYFREANEALRAGDTQRDPIPQAFEAFVAATKRDRPQVFGDMVSNEVQGLIEKMYQRARAEGNENLLAAVANIDHHLFGKFKTKEEIRTVTPIDSRARELEQRERTLAQTEQERTAREWNSWTVSAKDRSEQAVDGMVNATLGKIKGLDAGQKKEIKVQLDAELSRTFQDPNWRRGTQLLAEEAYLAGPQRRQEILQQHVNRMKLKAESIVRAKLPQIVKSKTVAIKQVADERHKRIDAQQKKNGSPGTGQPVQRQVPKAPSGFASREDWTNMVDSLFT